MKKLFTTIDLTPVKREIVSAREFRKIVRDRPHTISKSRFVSPNIGEADFGRFEVVYTIPILKHVAS